ncbi:MULTISPECIES: coniferyl-alcohol dehydrogenase [Sphingobium]|jgi:NAD(P)-dependent dehydrogenase (short-subunit alcohol dehydrogenase family)|uniref:3-alpha-hydroxysteroid dehydrogenase n=1 Tax=Sphingobium yanoikuyae TaxID=13690 RepID=A0A085JZA4_SPHYA|nr:MULTISPECIES: coniferyl-alcohol dehydrogenase [Sphingobium]ATI82128.1 3-alpha-hydroxysteroid dehydrogenase [Sphingobium yanoikuyae]ATP17792.1 3-alpha-hydroxysteroid dehydrogenase [Sphingobium yanoikuyae]AYO79441.1 SDR family oxidoreductase [Sphingobium yanoikuyae]KFD25800.1 3-alpha-hydroxysteroid dehydrogenase [Sphingobium yanoikuyae]KMW28728.1 3-alpha-hydroxysteroid dehydrogenase [Sphingobium yanoikuyae]
MSDILGYKGKRVIVSGCFSGMGEATAKLLLELGAEVHGLDFRDSSLPLASFTNVDLRDPASIEAAVAGIGGKVDALFNCAGLPQSFPPLDVMKVNFIGLRHLTEQVLPLMGPGGAIASIASTGGLGWSRRIPTNMEFVTTKGYDAAVAWCEAHLDDVVKEGYSFSKENVIVWTQYMGAHLIKKGIRINCTLPSPTQTPMMATFEAASGKDVVAAAAEPMGRYSTPAEQAGGIVLLNSDLAGIVNGVVFPVDGGFMGGVATGQVDLSVMMRRSAPAEA